MAGVGIGGLEGLKQWGGSALPPLCESWHLWGLEQGVGDGDGLAGVQDAEFLQGVSKERPVLTLRSAQSLNTNSNPILNTATGVVLNRSQILPCLSSEPPDPLEAGKSASLPV